MGLTDLNFSVGGADSGSVYKTRPGAGQTNLAPQPGNGVPAPIVSSDRAAPGGVSGAGLPTNPVEGQQAADQAGVQWVFRGGKWGLQSQDIPGQQAQPGSPGVPLPGSWVPGNPTGATAPPTNPGGSWSGTPIPASVHSMVKEFIPGGGPSAPSPGYLPAPGSPGALHVPVTSDTAGHLGITPTPNPGYLPAPAAPGGAQSMADKYYNPPPAAPPPAVPGASAPGSLTPEMQGMIDKYTAGRPVGTIQPTTVGPAGVATAGTSVAPTVATTTLDRTQDNQTREQQQQSITDLFNASRGLTPSAAELQSRQTLDRNVANQYAIAAALQGRSAGGALKQASDATGALNAQGAADAAVLRAKEQDSARAALSSMLLGVRNTDVTAENAQGQLTSASNLKQADVTSATGIANAGNETTASTTNANNQTQLTKTQADIDAERRQNDVVNTLKARGLDDEQIGRFLTAMTTGRGQDITAATAARGQDITARGQDLQATADAARDATARTLGIAKIDLERSLADWAKTKDVTTLVGSLLAAGATNGAVQKFISGLTSGSTGDGGDYGYSGVDGGPGAPNAATDPNGTVSGNGNYGPESSDNDQGTG